MIRMGVSGWMFLLVPAYPGGPGQKAVKRLCVCVCARMCACVHACVRACCCSVCVLLLLWIHITSLISLPFLPASQSMAFFTLSQFTTYCYWDCKAEFLFVCLWSIAAFISHFSLYIFLPCRPINVFIIIFTEMIRGRRFVVDACCCRPFCPAINSCNVLDFFAMLF